MSSQADYVDPSLNEESVAEYLANDPGFFERNAHLLKGLRLPHASGGTVSLVERQVSVLRQREIKLEKQLRDLIDVARSNDQLAAKIHAFALHLLSAADLPSTLRATEEAMRSGFSADHAVMVLFADPETFGEVLPGRFLRVLSRQDESLAPFSTFLKSSAPRCGSVRDAQLAFLFKKDADEVGSVALVPMGDDCEHGFLALGSRDSERFHPGVSTEFLSRIGELITEAIRRF